MPKSLYQIKIVKGKDGSEGFILLKKKGKTVLFSTPQSAEMHARKLQESKKGVKTKVIGKVFPDAVFKTAAEVYYIVPKESSSESFDIAA